MPSLTAAQLLLKLTIEYKKDLWEIKAWAKRTKMGCAPWAEEADPAKTGLSDNAKKMIRAVIVQVSHNTVSLPMYDLQNLSPDHWLRRHRRHVAVKGPDVEGWR